MKAVIQIGVRAQGRVRELAGPHVSIMQQKVDVPENFVEQQLAVAISVAEIKRALDAAGADSDELDTVEITVDFEDEADDTERITIIRPADLMMTPEEFDALFGELRDAFRAKFGREPQDDDPVFFDEDADEPVPLSEEKMRARLLEWGLKAGIDERTMRSFLERATDG